MFTVVGIEALLYAFTEELFKVRTVDVYQLIQPENAYFAGSDRFVDKRFLIFVS